MSTTTLSLMIVWACCYPVTGRVFAQQPPVEPGHRQNEKKPVAPPPAKTDLTGTSKDANSILGPPALPPPTPLPDLLAKAAQFVKNQNVLDAVKAYREAIAVYPQAYQPYDRLARLTFGTKNYDEAIDAARKATQLNTTNQSELVQEYSILANALTERGRYTEARTAVDHTIALVPTDVDARLMRGEIDMRAKDYPAAETDFLAGLGLSPDNFRVHSGLGDVYEQENRHGSALDEYQAAIRALKGSSIQDTDLSSQLTLSEATALAGLKRYAEAEAEVRSQLARAPDNPGILGVLAQVLDTEGKHDAAISEYKLALAKSADDAILWGNLGWAEYNGAQFDAAEQSSRKALALDPKQVYVRFNLGLIFAVRNRWSEAAKEYQAAVTSAAEPDIRAAINDVRDALDKGFAMPALHQALDFLATADHKALGYSD